MLIWISFLLDVIFVRFHLLLDIPDMIEKSDSQTEGWTDSITQPLPPLLLLTVLPPSIPPVSYPHLTSLHLISLQHTSLPVNDFTSFELSCAQGTL
jgi:hypothetical protein